MDKLKKSVNYKNLLKQWIEPHNKKYIVLTVDSDCVVYCQVCNKMITCIKKSQIVQHINTTLHSSALKRKTDNKKQLFVLEAKSKNPNIFNEELCASLISANIPWNKLQVPQFKAFLEKYTGNHIPDERTLRKNYLGPLFDKTLESIRIFIGDSNIWFTVDETTDLKGRYIANLLVGVLKNDMPTQPYLISFKELDKTNHSTVSRFINNSLKTLWPLGGHDEKVLLMLSDAAPYMVKTGDVLKVFYPNIIHTTCLAHMLNRIAEKVREIYPNVNTLINNIKKSFLKAPSRVQLYREELPGVPLPPEPVVTRWGTWIEAVIFNTDHYLGIKTVIGKLDNDSAASVEKCRQMFMLDSVKNDMIYIKAHFTALVTAITNLEQSNLTLVSSLEIVQTIICKLTNIPGEKGIIIKTKVNQLYQKKQRIPNVRKSWEHFMWK